MEIIEDNSNRIRCSCGVTLKYEDNDINTMQVDNKRFIKYVECPKCELKLATQPASYKDIMLYKTLLKDELYKLTLEE